MKIISSKATEKHAVSNISIASSTGGRLRTLMKLLTVIILSVAPVKSQENERGQDVVSVKKYCGEGTFFNAEKEMCIGIQAFNPFDPSHVVGKSSSCESEDLLCFCESHGFGGKNNKGLRGPSLVPHSDCAK